MPALDAHSPPRGAAKRGDLNIQAGRAGYSARAAHSRSLFPEGPGEEAARRSDEGNALGVAPGKASMPGSRPTLPPEGAVGESNAQESGPGPPMCMPGPANLDSRREDGPHTIIKII